MRSSRSRSTGCTIEITGGVPSTVSATIALPVWPVESVAMTVTVSGPSAAVTVALNDEPDSDAGAPFTVTDVIDVPVTLPFTCTDGPRTTAPAAGATSWTTGAEKLETCSTTTTPLDANFWNPLFEKKRNSYWPAADGAANDSTASVSGVAGGACVPLRNCQARYEASAAPTCASATQSVVLPGPPLTCTETVAPDCTVTCAGGATSLTVTWAVD